MRKPAKRKFGLLPRVIVAILLGIVMGHYLPEWVTRGFATFNDLFNNFLGFMIPLIIIGLVTPAIGNIGKGAGKLLLFTVIIAYGDTIVAGLFSFFTSTALFPSLIKLGSGIKFSPEAIHGIQPYFSIPIPPMIDVMSALIFAFLLGLGIAYSYVDTLRSFFNEFQQIIARAIKVVIIPLLPLYIMGIFMTMAATGQARRVIEMFIAIIGVIFAMHIALLLFQFCIAGSISKTNPLKALRKMMPAYFTALGTSSSAATIPVTLKCVESCGVDRGVAGFTVPLCATIHLSGSTMKITACAIALMLMQGASIDPATFIWFILLLGVMMVAAPGVPGGAIMAALGVLQSVLGFDTSQQAMMIALYIAMDSFGTACNVTGDGAIALLVNRINSH